ncbi:MAG: hypothetical protein U0457_03735 [Candidatus Sericytochromatia bacterium]
MFNILKSKKNKISDSDNPLAMINEAKAMTNDRDEKRLETANNLYNEALILIEEFKKTNDANILEEASGKLEESLKYSRSKGETYFWLAYVLYIYKKDKEAFAYLKIAEELSPDYPKINEFKNIISST